jgi:mycothiol synthase
MGDRVETGGRRAGQVESAAPEGEIGVATDDGGIATEDVRVETTDRLEPSQIEAVIRLAEAAKSADGAAPLNEAALLHLRHVRPGIVHLLAEQAQRLVGYAQLHGQPPSRTGELVVHPAHRGHGVGRKLLAAMIAHRPLRVWAMGDTAAAQALARGSELVPVRQLLIMKRSLASPISTTPPPDGVTIRTFAVGVDETAWLAVNARAFAGHPEQGGIGLDDLADRMAEPWFDPDGFFVAVRDSAMIAFHWTKQHPGRLGEVYVLGVDPRAGGEGLGRALLGTGLEYLRQRGNIEVELYVEADNEPAIALYRGYGFKVASRDVMYASKRDRPRLGGSVNASAG